MTKANWDIFRAKFRNHQSEFEWLCYLLICREFGRAFGIFRYKNQAAIETDPIEKDGDVIGWQAKFYDTTLTGHEDELNATLERAKKNYPDMTKLILYTNQEWAQTKGSEPKGKKEVEGKAKSLGIQLEWRTAGFFESPFVSIENEIIARHFFSSGRTSIDMMDDLRAHADNVLSEIQTCISFGSQSIEIDRSKAFEEIESSSGQALIISGVAGVGKTAIIKKYYNRLKGEQPFCIFKATEFELGRVDELFGGYTFRDFLEIHKDEKEKIILIDSAEKLLYLRNTDPLKEFLSGVTKEGWKIIFTTRDSYLEDLNFQFFEIYKIIPVNINIQDLKPDELTALAGQYRFTLPKEGRLLELIRNPFYLNEYLKSYENNEVINYADFKQRLWDRVIKKSKPAREQCFLRLTRERINSGQFFVNPDCESQLLDDELKGDGVLGYESPHGYFITHDIYEEWALEKIIEVEFGRKENNAGFFQEIGNSLPMRRALRTWVSEELSSGSGEIKPFIEEVLKDDGIKPYWKEEILISILLSDYSKRFFEIFENELLDNGQELLKRLTFLLRIACKEVDDDFFRSIGVKTPDWLSFQYVFTKPKGSGWEDLIKFAFEHLSKIGIQNISFILPVIHDWTAKFKDGETTRLSSLIALQFYQWAIQEEVYFSDRDAESRLLQTILYGASEIKGELEKIVEEVVRNKWKHHRDPYYALSKTILAKPEGAGVSRVIPASVLQLADLFWRAEPERGHYGHSPTGVEQYYDMEDDHLEYSPASSYQTPVYWLLQHSLQETIDFILKFTNEATESFAKSDFAKHEVEEVEVFIEKGKPIRQYISDRLWCTYRGTQVAPDVLQSMHMALEKFFLERGAKADPKTLTGWLLYLVRNSRSASISGVVASIVLAYPEKTIEAARVLFRTKEFFFYDTRRWMLDQTQKSSLQSLRDNFGGIPEKRVHEDERLEACDFKHRKSSLENLFLEYQLFKSEGVTEVESEGQRQALWEILDDYYKELPDPSQESDSDKTWRIFLARVDVRKMKPSAEETEGGVVLKLNPELSPELREYSEKSVERSSEPMKYTPLRMWAHYKSRGDERYRQYDQYEKDPRAALAEVQEIISKIGAAGEEFQLFNYSIPAEVCSALVSHHLDALSDGDRAFCKDIVLGAASLPGRDNYQYQISDGVQPAISALPVLFDGFPGEREHIKSILLLTLFNDYPVDMAGTSFNAIPTAAIHRLWEAHFADAQSLLLGYLLLKPKYEELRERIRHENYKKGVHEISEAQVIERFLEENEENLQRFLRNKTTMADLESIGELDLYILKTAFQLIPLRTENGEHRAIAQTIVAAFAAKLLSDKDREDEVDYSVEHDFLKKLVYLVLSSPDNGMQDLLNPFLDHFNGSEAIAELFKEFISAEDSLDSYDNFWKVWGAFMEEVIELCKKGDGYLYIDDILKSYLFAETPWKDSAKEWHTFKEKDKDFFRTMSERTGHCRSTLYAISKLLNGLGSTYLDDGIHWVSGMLKKNKNLVSEKLDTNTVYYLENVARRYIYKNREKIRKINQLKQDVMIVLDSLILRGSVIAYMLRENVL